MYHFYLGRLLLPIAPASLSISIKGQNKTVNLINEGEINIIKASGLTEISFDFMIPHTKYPFASYGTGGVIGATLFLSELEKLKTQDKPFQFIVSRMGSGFKLLHHTNIKVTLEDYTIKEDAEYGLDQIVSVNLKQYKPYATKVLEVDKNGNAQAKKKRG